MRIMAWILQTLRLQENEGAAASLGRPARRAGDHDCESVRVGTAGPGTDVSGVSCRVYGCVAVLRARCRARHQPDPARTPDCAVRRAVADGLCGGSRDFGV